MVVKIKYSDLCKEFIVESGQWKMICKHELVIFISIPLDLNLSRCQTVAHCCRSALLQYSNMYVFVLL